MPIVIETEDTIPTPIHQKSLDETGWTGFTSPHSSNVGQTYGPAGMGIGAYVNRPETKPGFVPFKRSDLGYESNVGTSMQTRGPAGMGMGAYMNRPETQPGFTPFMSPSSFRKQVAHGIPATNQGYKVWNANDLGIPGVRQMDINRAKREYNETMLPKVLQPDYYTHGPVGMDASLIPDYTSDFELDMFLEDLESEDLGMEPHLEAQSQWKRPENLEKTIKSLELRPEFEGWTHDEIKYWIINQARANRGGIIGLNGGGTIHQDSKTPLPDDLRDQMYDWILQQMMRQREEEMREQWERDRNPMLYPPPIPEGGMEV